MGISYNDRKLISVLIDILVKKKEFTLEYGAWIQYEHYAEWLIEKAKTMPECSEIRAKTKAREYRGRWGAGNALRHNARKATNKAIKGGLLLIKDECEECGNFPTNKHHNDYNDPMDIAWLCRPCHREKHPELSEALFR